MRALIIEDEHKIANAIKNGLEHANYAVTISHNGTQGFDMASIETFDVIILDILLPGMDGLEICQKLRENEINTPILILTAKGQVEEKVAGLDAGADDYLTKPFALVELLARVKALTRRQAHHVGTLLAIGDLTVNTLNYQVKRGDSLIRLSSTEYSLLEFLMRHKDEVVTKEQIISHVWDYDADVLPNSVEVYINFLRKKIDGINPEHPLIHTLRGFGYMIADQSSSAIKISENP